MECNSACGYCGRCTGAFDDPYALDPAPVDETPNTREYTIADSNARQNEYWKRVGGHPDAGQMDADDDRPYCLWCGEPIDDPWGGDYAPFCSSLCALRAERDSVEDTAHEG